MRHTQIVAIDRCTPATRGLSRTNRGRVSARSDPATAGTLRVADADRATDHCTAQTHATWVSQDADRRTHGARRSSGPAWLERNAPPLHPGRPASVPTDLRPKKSPKVGGACPARAPRRAAQRGLRRRAGRPRCARGTRFRKKFWRCPGPCPRPCFGHVPHARRWGWRPDLDLDLNRIWGLTSGPDRAAPGMRRSRTTTSVFSRRYKIVSKIDRATGSNGLFPDGRHIGGHTRCRNWRSP
jgi:hypothetical protein